MPAPRRRFGLGDFVALFAQPIARLIDLLFYTHIHGCAPCGKRQSWLNALPGRVWRWLVTHGGRY